MSVIVVIAVTVFFMWVLHDIFSRFVFNTTIEGMESTSTYQNYDPNLEVQVNKNTANIEFLKGQVDTLNQNSSSINTTVSNLTSQVNTLQEQVQGLTNAQQAYLQPEIANAEPDEEDDEEDTTLVPQEEMLDQTATK